jgi:beta-phosphoglucomutase-like phosphatase (HAD superfamily)
MRRHGDAHGGEDAGRKRARDALEQIEELSQQGLLKEGAYLTVCNALAAAHQAHQTHDSREIRRSEREEARHTRRERLHLERREAWPQRREEVLRRRRDRLETEAREEAHLLEQVRARLAQAPEETVQTIVASQTRRGARMTAMAIVARNV